MHPTYTFLSDLVELQCSKESRKKNSILWMFSLRYILAATPTKLSFPTVASMCCCHHPASRSNYCLLLYTLLLSTSGVLALLFSAFVNMAFFYRWNPLALSQQNTFFLLLHCWQSHCISTVLLQPCLHSATTQKADIPSALKYCVQHSLGWKLTLNTLSFNFCITFWHSL